MSKGKWLAAITLAIGVTVVLLAENNSSNPPVPGGPPLVKATTPDAPEATGPVLPKDEQYVLKVVYEARQRYKDGANDMAKGAARPWRKDRLCAPAAGAEEGSQITVRDWVGKIYSLSSNSEGKGVIEIQIGDDVWVHTWNNALSDIGDHTLLQPGSAAFEAASKLEEGQTVRFSGAFLWSQVDCFEESSMSLSGSMQEPEFIFRFRSISAVGD